MIYTVTELCAKYQTDKGIINTTLDPQTWMHDYSIFYDKIFYPAYNSLRRMVVRHRFYTKDACRYL